jgi:cell division protein FtsW
MKPQPALGQPAAAPDRWMILVLAVLLALGTVMVYSSSAVFAAEKLSQPDYYLKRHLLALAIGLLAMFGVYRLGYQRLSRLAYPALLLCLMLLILVLIPGVGTRAGGSSRWFRFAGFSFQPGELAKPVFVLYLACSLTRKKEKVKVFGQGFLPHLMVCGAAVLLLLLQPDFGTATILTLITFCMLFLAGTRLRYLVASALAAVPLVYVLVAGSEYRLRRLLAFWDPWTYRYDIGYQISESLMGFGSGGWLGVGLGAGRHKLFFLPAAHTDFIFSLVGEELGLVGTLLVLGLFSVLVWRGLRLALKAPDLFGCYLAFGLSLLIGLQAMVNMAVVTGLLPTKGLTLPFFSFGGSSLICNLAAMGVLLSISRSAAESVPPAKVTWP